MNKAARPVCILAYPESAVRISVTLSTVSPLSSTSTSRSYATMPDHFVTTTRTSWLGNIMNSFVGVLFGIILFVVAFPVLWFNEGRTNMATVAQSSVQVDGASVNTQTEGQQVAVAGPLASGERLG